MLLIVVLIIKMNLFFVIVVAVLAFSLADDMWSSSYDQVMAEKDKTLAMV